MLSLEEARGLAAKIWTHPNFRRRVMDAQLCEAIANLLVDEVAKNNMDDEKQNQKVADFERLKAGHEKLKAHYTEAQNQIDKLKHAGGEAADLKVQLNKLQLDFTNLQSEYENLKLQAGKKDEAV